MTKDTSRVLYISRMVDDLRTIMQEFAKQSDDPAVEEAWGDARGELDNWRHDSINKGVLNAIENAEYDQGITEAIREARVFHSAYWRR